MGVFVGTGDQDNYVKLVVSANDGAPELQVVQELAGVATTQAVPLSLSDVTALDLYLTIDPTTACSRRAIGRRRQPAASDL